MWSLTSPRAERISGPEKFHSSARKDFCNNIGTFRTQRDVRLESVVQSKADFGERNTRPAHDSDARSPARDVERERDPTDGRREPRDLWAPWGSALRSSG
jgi:hypothetical protein